FSQELLWLMDRLHPGSVAYNAPGAHRLIGPLDLDALQAALLGVVARQESLRTRYLVEQGEPRQIVADASPVTLARHDLSHLSGAEQEEALEHLLRDESRRPFDLSADTLLRAALVRMGPDDHVLLAVLHHIASDGWSRGILFKELAELYAAEREGRAP